MEQGVGAKKTGLAVIATYEMCNAVVNGLIKDAAALLEGRVNRQIGNIRILREWLARFAGMRRKDFDGATEAISADIRRIKKGLTEASIVMRDVDDVALNVLTRMVNGGKVDPASIRRDILPHRRRREREAARSLTELDMELSEHEAVLERLLSKGETIRVKDLKEAVEFLDKRRNEKSRITKTLLDEIWMIRQELLEEWLSFIAAYERYSYRVVP